MHTYGRVAGRVFNRQIYIRDVESSGRSAGPPASLPAIKARTEQLKTRAVVYRVAALSFSLSLCLCLSFSIYFSSSHCAFSICERAVPRTFHGRATTRIKPFAARVSGEQRYEADRPAGRQASEQVFSAEIPIRMRIDMRIRHGNAIREIGPSTLEGAYSSFFLFRLPACLPATVGRDRQGGRAERSKLSSAGEGETWSAQPRSMPITEVSLLFHSWRAWPFVFHRR